MFLIYEGMSNSSYISFVLKPLKLCGMVAEFNSKVCSPYMFVDVSPSFGLETEGRVPDGVVSPSSGPDMQGLLYVPLVSDRFGQFNSFVQQSNRHTRVAGLH